MVNKNKQFLEKEKVAQEKRHWVRLTRVCNNNCVFCLDKEAQNGTFISIKDIKRDLEKGIKEKAKRVVLSGGEPTVHPQFIKIVKLAKDLGYKHIQIITNGRMFAYKNFLDGVIKAGVNEITFSLHGHTQKIHEIQTQIKGSFKQSLGGLINALKSKRAIISVDVVINKYNYKYLFDILKFYIDLGVSEFDLLQVIPFGQAWVNRDKVFYDIPKALPYLKKAFQLSKNPGITLWTNRFFPEYLEGFEDLIQHPRKLYDEIGGREEMFKQFLEKNKTMWCYGERCYYCFLRDFCKDLIKFNKGDELQSYDTPKCLARFRKQSFKNSKSKILKQNNQADLFGFLNFYIQNRYFVKSLRCQKCKFNKSCQGASINHIRNFGFKILSPRL